MFGYSEEEVMGRPYSLVVPEEQDEFQSRFGRLASGEVLRNLPSHRRLRDGTVIDTSIRVRRPPPTQVQNQLRQAQKMEAIGQLTGGLAHDFNNPIGIALGNLDLLAERFDVASEERELTEAAIQAALRGAELTRQLLAFSRRQPIDHDVACFDGQSSAVVHCIPGVDREVEQCRFQLRYIDQDGADRVRYVQFDRDTFTQTTAQQLRGCFQHRREMGVREPDSGVLFAS
jgi:signal transduction histidine kinase